MSSAMEREWKAWAWAGLGLWIGIGGTGCARLHGSRNAEHPPLGSLITNGKNDVNPPLGVDAFSGQVVKAPQAPPRALLAHDATESTTGEKGLIVRSTAPPPGALMRSARQEPSTRPPAVALQPPGSADQAGIRPLKGRDEAIAPSSLSNPPVRRPAAADDPIRTMEGILGAARTRLEGLSTYQVALTRQERVGSELLPSEDVIMSIRRSPRAVRIEWPDGPHKGREAIYAADQDGGLMKINLADMALPVPPLSMPPDSPLALRNSRHPITEAGFDQVLTNVETSIQQRKSGDPAAGQLTFEGLQSIPESERPCHLIRQVKPGGETWLVYLDSGTRLPALVHATAANGDLLEHYAFRNLKVDAPELASADAFNPKARWGQARGGLFQRLAKGPSTTPVQDAGSLPQ